MILKNTFFFNRTEFQQSWNGDISAKSSIENISKGTKFTSLLAHEVITSSREKQPNLNSNAQIDHIIQKHFEICATAQDVICCFAKQSMRIIHLCKKATYIPIFHFFSYKDLKIRSWVLTLTAQWGFFGGEAFLTLLKNHVVHSWSCTITSQCFIIRRCSPRIERKMRWKFPWGRDHAGKECLGVGRSSLE